MQRFSLHWLFDDDKVYLSNVQLRISVELYTFGPVGHWLRDKRWADIADHSAKQVAVSGSHRRSQRKLVSRSPKLNCDRSDIILIECKKTQEVHVALLCELQLFVPGWSQR